MSRPKFLFYISTLSVTCFALLAAGCNIASIQGTDDDSSRNMIIGLLGARAAGCAKYADTPVANPLFTGGTRTLYQTAACDTGSWPGIGFDSNGVTTVSTNATVVAASPFNGYGTNIEVTFTVVSSSGTLDIMAYGSGSASSGLSSTSPAIRLAAGSACAMQYRKSTDSLLYNVSTCTDPTVLSAGQSYTYCIDFDRGTSSSGSYGFGNMLAAWSKPCADVAVTDRDQMTDLKLMQMMSIPVMNPASNSLVGFSANGITLTSIRIGNTVYASNM